VALGWLLLGGAAGAAGAWALSRRMPSVHELCEDSFRRVRLVDISKTEPRAEIDAPYAKLVEAFGEPDRYAEADTSNEWAFRGPGGLYVLYDTSIEGDGSKRKTYRWHVGAQVAQPELFLAWLEYRLRTQGVGRSKGQ
jgi:hypothetical protein